MTRTDGGSSGLASMRLVVLSDKRSSLCFVLMIVQAVLLWTPSAFACLSNATHPSATKASAMCLILVAYLRYVTFGPGTADLSLPACPDRSFSPGVTVSM